MRIAIVVNRFPTLSETFIFNKAKGLVQRGIEVTVIVHDSQNDSYAYKEDWKVLSTQIKIVKAFSKRDIFSVRLFEKVLTHLFSSLIFLREGRKNIKKRSELLRSYLLWLGISDAFDVIHFEYSGLAITYLDVIPHFKRAKIFVSCRGAAEQIKPLVDKTRAKDLKQLFQVVDRVHCVSNNMLNTCVTLYGLDILKAFVNRPAIDIAKFKRLNTTHRLLNAPYVFCSTGRLHWKKGIEYALLAMKELKQKGYAFTYEIIGDGIELEKLLFMIYDLGIQDHVVFSGSLPSYEVKARLEKCDIYLSPSLSEGISNAVLEAMAMELPVIATRAGGMDEVIESGVNGILVNCYDPIAISSSITYMLENVNLRNSMREKGKHTIDMNFNMAKQIEEFIRQYSDF